MAKQFIGVKLEADQLATIRQYAKDQGYPSTSSALRRIVQEWVMFKAERENRLVDPRPQYDATSKTR